MLIVLVVLGLLYYNYLNNRAARNQAVEQKTEKEILLEYDFETEYPKTVRDVVKLYGRYLECIYGQELEEGELELLNEQMRKLYSTQLLAYNPSETQLTDLKDELAYYEEENLVVSDYQVDQAEDIHYATMDDNEYASIELVLKLKGQKNGVAQIVEEILLIKEDDRWKIQGWSVITSDDGE